MKISKKDMTVFEMVCLEMVVKHLFMNEYAIHPKEKTNFR